MHEVRVQMYSNKGLATTVTPDSSSAYLGITPTHLVMTLVARQQPLDCAPHFIYSATLESKIACHRYFNALILLYRLV